MSGFVTPLGQVEKALDFADLSSLTDSVQQPSMRRCCAIGWDDSRWLLSELGQRQHGCSPTRRSWLSGTCCHTSSGFPAKPGLTTQSRPAPYAGVSVEDRRRPHAVRSARTSGC